MDIIESCVTYVKKELQGAEAGHDWFHIERVWKNTQRIADAEGADRLVCELAALLHDIADSKFHQGDEEIGPRTAAAFLRAQACPEDIVLRVDYIIRNISFKGGHDAARVRNIELDVVQDADRLDAIGAIGIARTFHYGGFKNRLIYDPAVAPNLQMSKEEYKNSSAPTINHFYEKLLLLKDRMNTVSGKRLAERRHAFMEDFLKEFYREWNAED